LQACIKSDSKDDNKKKSLWIPQNDLAAQLFSTLIIIRMFLEHQMLFISPLTDASRSSFPPKGLCPLCFLGNADGLLNRRLVIVVVMRQSYSSRHNQRWLC